MGKNIVNQRFIDCINFLLESKKAPSKSFLAEKFNISNPKFSEILKERMNVGVDILMILVSEFNISSEWLLTGQGSMLKENSNISIGRDNYGVNNTGNIGYNNDITINQEYTREQNKQDIADSQEHNNEIINLLKAQLKDKEEKEAMYKDKITYLSDKISDLERRLELAELKSKEAMSAKIEMQRVRLQAKKALISEKDEIIFAQNEEINAMKSVNTASNDAQQIQPSKGV